MKISILLSAVILAATSLTTLNAYADDQNLLCRRSGNECSSLRGSGQGKLSISGLNVSVSSDRNNKNRNKEDTVQNDQDNDRDAKTGPSDNNDTANIDNNTGNTVDADNGTENDNDTVVDNNTNPPQLNSNDIEGYDPFGGLYGPGT